MEWKNLRTAAEEIKVIGWRRERGCSFQSRAKMNEWWMGGALVDGGTCPGTDDGRTDGLFIRRRMRS